MKITKKKKVHKNRSVTLRHVLPHPSVIYNLIIVTCLLGLESNGCHKTTHLLAYFGIPYASACNTQWFTIFFRWARRNMERYAGTKCPGSYC
jgi:hypothetical protein